MQPTTAAAGAQRPTPRPNDGDGTVKGNALVTMNAARQILRRRDTLELQRRTARSGGTKLSLRCVLNGLTPRS